MHKRGWVKPAWGCLLSCHVEGGEGPMQGRQRQRGWPSSHRTAWGQRQPERDAPPPFPPNPTYSHCTTTPSLQPCIWRLKQQPLWSARLHISYWIYAYFPPPFSYPSNASAPSPCTQELYSFCTSFCSQGSSAVLEKRASADKKNCCQKHFFAIWIEMPEIFSNVPVQHERTVWLKITEGTTGAS